MKRSKLATAVLAGVGIGVVLIPMAAQAGHTNTVLETSLRGKNEVAPPGGTQGIAGDPNGRGEAYVFGIDGDTKTLCYLINADKIAELDLAPGGPRMAHIHEGAAGTNGPVVVSLAFPQGGQSADCISESEATFNPNGTDATVAEILADPEEYYVNVHNSVYPGGAIRGQLSAH